MAMNRPIKGKVIIAHNAISETATSDEIKMDNHNAVLVAVTITGTGTWKIDLQGRLDTAGTVIPIVDNNDNVLTTGNLTSSTMKLFVAVPNMIKIVATEVSGTATCTVRVQPITI